ncbi:unnamed protein product [Thelazia callipaeda]|uniref:Jumonji domain-containing protein 4 n=1 Tax=Thelazia callipaeda TaxID=103827 RepID=A0A0N5CP94_THECL|nr:unnamed protein product [Thelazia callipaeda]
MEDQRCNAMLIPKICLEQTHVFNVFIDFMLKNQPFRTCSHATSQWKSRKYWVKQVNGKSVINTEFLVEHYGQMEVPVRKEMPHCSAKCEKIKLKDYIQKLRKNNGSDDAGYVKDWHFQQDSGTSCEMYGLPSVFRFDWINNEIWSNDERSQLGDYRFVYFGVENTWTPFHADVMSSFSWSANICGRKLWYFVTPGKEEYFRLDRHSFLKDIRTARDKWSEADVLSFVQEEGEIFFVPSNWYHQVHNLEDTISINHNFINASNVGLVVELITERLKDVDRELTDCKDYFSSIEYNRYCEQILSADIRVNLATLSSLLHLISNDRKNDVDECWTCPKHRSFLDCKTDNDCLESMRQSSRNICTCTLANNEICFECSNFMKKIEISVAAQCLTQIRGIIESRG